MHFGVSLYWVCSITSAPAQVFWLENCRRYVFSFTSILGYYARIEQSFYSGIIIYTLPLLRR